MSSRKQIPRWGKKCKRFLGADACEIKRGKGAGEGREGLQTSFDPVKRKGEGREMARKNLILKYSSEKALPIHHPLRNLFLDRNGQALGSPLCSVFGWVCLGRAQPRIKWCSGS